MTDSEVLGRVLGCVDPKARELRILRRNGRVLLALPAGGKGMRSALRLYQPQRPAARLLVAALHGLSRIGAYGPLMPRLRFQTTASAFNPALPDIVPKSCGILLGSPEHAVRRAIVSYLNGENWEVAKVSFGDKGAQLLEQEAQILHDLQPLAAGVPPMLGLHRGDGITVMRMPYLTGLPIPAGESDAALKLLNQWITNHAPKPITEFPEWAAIESALTQFNSGNRLIGILSRTELRPVICHGDFARWNLLSQQSGELVVLDWEWGHENGLPGVDLVHYFLQDARLVSRLNPTDAIRKTIGRMKSVDCGKYLDHTGWNADPILPIIACLAYKQGDFHQENSDVLNAALELYQKRSS